MRWQCDAALAPRPPEPVQRLSSHFCRETGLNILVTGGAGYVGSHACKALAARGHLPITYDNLSRGNRWAVKWGPFEKGDIADVRQVRMVIEKYRPSVPDPIASAIAHPIMLIVVIDNITNNAV
jgi:UDP-glucose 4-epimerase